MELVFIYGLPASGKLTVAKELSSLTGYKLFHNHLVVDLLLEVFEFGTKNFVELREQMWLEVFMSACDSGPEGLIFTFAPEKTVRQEFIQKTMSHVTATGSSVIFVELYCDHTEIERRLGSNERKRYKKMTSVEQLKDLVRAQTFDSPKMPKPRLRIDTRQHSPKESAELIARILRR